MKRFFAHITAVLLLVSLAGCFDPGSDHRVVFYYLRTEQEFHQNAQILSPEYRDLSGEQMLLQILKIYLEGPQDPLLTSPFPDKLSIVSVHTEGDSLYITVSDQLATLSGAPLILACACLGRTGMEISGAEEARISCKSLPLDGKRSIIVDGDSILYYDALSSGVYADKKE